MAVAVTTGTKGGYQFQGLFDVIPFKATGVDFASAADAATVAVELTVPGVALGDIVISAINVDVADLTWDAAVTAAGKVTVTVNNNTGAAVDLASKTVTGAVLKPKGVFNSL
jgi:hypothetical protein